MARQFCIARLLLQCRASPSFTLLRSSSSARCAFSAFHAEIRNGRHISTLSQDVTHFNSCRSLVSTQSRGFASGVAVADEPPYQVLTLPSLSPTMTTGNIQSWLKKEGDKVAPGDVLCTIETDKATMDLDAQEEGFLAKILVLEGTKDIPVGQPIAIIVEDAEDVVKISNTSTEAYSQGDNKKEEVLGESTSQEAEAPSGRKSGRLGPSVRRLLSESGLDIASLIGTGPEGMVVKGDVLSAMKSGPKSVKPPPSIETAKSSRTAKPLPMEKSLPQVSSSSEEQLYDDLPTSQIRKIIAARLLESKNGIPHFYMSADVILDEMLRLRKKLKENHGVTVSVNDIVIKAVAVALRSVPEVNAYWDDKKGEPVLDTAVDISIAVATEKGLMTPILRDADQLSLSSISAEVKKLAGKARDGKLAPHEFQGGSFSISNLGMFPVSSFSAIINPPQACILAVGRGENTVIWEEDSTGEGRPKAVTKMSLTISADHRVIDADIGGRFLDSLISTFRDPQRILL